MILGFSIKKILSNICSRKENGKTKTGVTAFIGICRINPGAIYHFVRIHQILSRCSHRSSGPPKGREELSYPSGPLLIRSGDKLNIEKNFLIIFIFPQE